MSKRITHCLLRQTSIMPPPQGQLVESGVCITLFNDESPMHEIILTFEEFRRIGDEHVSFFQDTCFLREGN